MKPTSTATSIALALCLSWLALAAAPTPAAAQEGGSFGLGVIVGDPTGLSGKYFLSPDHAIDGAVGLGLIGGHHLAAHADLLWQLDLTRFSAGTLDLHFGVGPMLALRDKSGDGAVKLGARVPLGLSLMFSEAPFDLFVEVAAGLWAIDKPGLDVDAAFGGRYWF